MHALIAVVTLVPTIWIVDAANGPGTSFTDLPPAVAAAASGDTIIVKPGTYTAFSVSAKALTIFGSGASSTLVSLLGNPASGTSIAAVPAGTTFYVSGLWFAPPSPYLVGLFVQDNPGTIVLSGVIVSGAQAGLSSTNTRLYASRCSFAGGAVGGGASGTQGAGVSGGVLVADDSTFQGGSGQFSAGQGLAISSAVVTLMRCSSAGGSTNGAGGSGIYVSSGFLRAARTSANTFTGGSGAGAPGVPVSVSPSFGGSAILHGNITLIPGSSLGGPGPTTSGSVTFGPPLPYLSLSGTLTTAGNLSATQPATMTLDGVFPLAPFVVAVGFTPSFSTAYAPLLLGELLVPIPSAFLFEGSLDAIGQTQITGTPSVASPALVGIPFYAQLGVLDSGAGNVRMSNCLIRMFE